MTLVIDAGNSAVKWAVAGAGPLAVQVELHRGRVDGLRARLAAAWRAAGPRAARACSVASAAVGDEIEAAARSLGIELVWLKTQDGFRGAFTLGNGYREPLQLGADRWHALIGACALQSGRAPPRASFVVVMAGTATTVDCAEAVDGGWRFVGGVIAPGVRLMLESLARGTAGLPEARGEPVPYPTDTDAAIVSGVFDAQAGLVQRVVQRFARRLGGAPRLLLGGGNAEALAPLLVVDGSEPVIADNLVLHGLLARTGA